MSRHNSWFSDISIWNNAVESALREEDELKEKGERSEKIETGTFSLELSFEVPDRDLILPSEAVRKKYLSKRAFPSEIEEEN